jgi:predicted RNase H-like HicB family nuclease
MQGGNDIAVNHPKPRVDWPDKIKVSIWLVCEGGDEWSALVSEFNVVGMGRSRVEAEANLRDNLHAYLESYAAEGAEFKDTYRRIPRKEALRLAFFALLTRAAKAITPKSRRNNIHFEGPRTVEHSGEAFGPIAC